ncbi:MAG: serine hydrolase [Planctomycetes bacterium]|nr:serine hydrolase [Planctomycetota bacterium]MCC7399343.1 serine hydrolase [Planctomycetota bacterium]
MRALLASAVGLFLTTVTLCQSPELPGVREQLERIAGELQLDGAGLVVVRDNQELHRSLHRGLGSEDVMVIASASKWLAVATVLTLVDDGQLDLDVPVARYLPEFDRSDKRMLTLRQCLANTGGVPARLPGRMRGMDMVKFAAAAADAALRDQPGSAFRYGGVGFQIAAAAACRVTGKSWHELFAQRIAAPLGLTQTKFGTLLPVGGDAGTAVLPWVAGGAVSTLGEYERFVQMLLAKGEFAGKRVLREESVAAMFRDQVADFVEVKAEGFEAAKVRYGLGTWLELLDGGVVRASDPGAFGFTPWIDLDLGVGGVLAVKDRVGRVLPKLQLLQQRVRAAVTSPAVVGEESVVTLSHGGRDRRYLMHVPPHEAGTAALPLLVVLHGGGGNGEQARETTRLAELGVRAGFVVVFPDGTGPLRQKLLTWNSGGILVYAAEHDVDDVGFLRQVVADVQQRVPIDADRVYAAGHSNGGMMCHRLAREAADVFRGIAVVAGAVNYLDADDQTPMAALIVHGTADEHVLYEGGAPRSSIGRSGERIDTPVAKAVAYYLERNGLVAHPVVEQRGKVRCEQYERGKGGAPAMPVRLITLEGGGHAWPGAANKTRAVADAPFPFDASAEIMRFLRELPPLSGGAPAPR